MTAAEVERLARDAGFNVADGDISQDDCYMIESITEPLTRFAELVQAAERERADKLAAWLQWCLDNCDDSPEHNFGTTAADHMRALLAGKPAPMPGK